MAYTDIDKPSDYFNTIIWTGASDTANRAFTGVGFQPDLVWSKIRDDTYHHNWFDSVRGAGSDKEINSDTSGAEGSGDTDGYGFISSFDTDGFSTTQGTASGGRNLEYNQNNNTFVAWNWKAGTSFSNDASSTSVGSVDSTGSVSTDAGFSIINVVKNNTTAHTVAHGLGAVPQMIIGKSRTGNAYRWIVYHQAIGNTHAQYLNENFANTDSVTFWNDTSPTSSVFSLGTDNSWNGTNIFYCFAEKKGYSKFGSYVGNGNADGTFVYTGFKPAFIIIKATSGEENWRMYDNKRNGFNVDNEQLFPNLNDAEASDVDLDILSNGFKCRRNSGGFNNSGTTYIYMAFAENPFTTSTGVPATAR